MIGVERGHNDSIAHTESPKCLLSLPLKGWRGMPCRAGRGGGWDCDWKDAEEGEGGSASGQGKVVIRGEDGPIGRGCGLVRWE